MADEVDLSKDRMELEDKIRKKYSFKPGKEAEASGYCLECGEDLPSEMRWCDAACRDMWEERRRLR